MISDFGRAVDSQSRRADDAPRDFNQVAVVAVGLINFYAREFGIVANVHAFIAKDSAQFIDALEASDDKPLEIKFSGNPQIKVSVQCIVMSDKRTSRRASCNRREHWRFNFDKVALVKVTSNRLDSFVALDERLAHFGINNQIKVALTITNLHIFKPVKLLRQRSKRLSQQCKIFHADG